MPTVALSPGRLAVQTKGQEELDRAGRKAAWTKRFSLPDDVNPYERGNYYRHKPILDPHRSAYWRATWDCRTEEGYQWGREQEALCKTRNALDARWAVHNTTTIRTGDRLFLLRQTKQPRGVVAVGTVTRAPYPDFHWREERAQAGDRTNYVNVRWDVFQSDPILVEGTLLAEIEEFIQWNARRSGTEVDRDVGFYLDQEIRRRVGGAQESAVQAVFRSKFFGGGESDAHRALKEHVARNPELIGLPPGIDAHVEHQFFSPDRADIVFLGQNGDAYAVEIELSGATNTLVGAWQALKYRLLLAVELGHDPHDGRVHAILVANEIAVDTRRFCDRYGVRFCELPTPQAAD